MLCNTDCIDFTDASSGTNITSWQWSFPGGTPATSTDQHPTGICYNDAGTYEVILTITDDQGTTSDTLPNYIEVSSCGPVAAITASATTICAEACVDFTDASTGNNINSWQWLFPGAETPSSTDQHPSGICYNTPGSYEVILLVTDDDGSATETFNDYITVTSCNPGGNCPDPQIPTALTPNSGDENSTVCVMGGCLSNMDFRIFNRWGELVFEATDQQTCWDGRHQRNGQLLSTGTYVFAFQGEDTDGTTITQKGNITLIR